MRGSAVPAPLWRVALAGLVAAAVFAMHGPSAGPGCADGDPMLGGAAVGAMVDTSTTAPVAAGVVRAAVGYGQICLSTPPRPGSAGVLIAALTVLIGPAARPIRLVAIRVGVRLRGPPRAGTALLRCLCVSRT